MPTGTEGAPRAEGWPGAAEEERACRSRGQSTASDVESGAAAVQFASATNGATAPHDAPADTCASLAEAPAAAERTARTGPGNGALQVVYGAKRIGCAAYELQCHASRRVRGMAKPPYVATRTLDSLESRKLVEGVRYQVIYDRSALARPPQLDITTKLVAQGEQARVLHAAPTKMIMVDEDAALLPLVIGESVESAIIVRGSAMLAALGRIFDDLWRFAAPFTAERDLGGDRRPTEEERWILSLLASGATDDAIGRLMGFSPRTAHRRVRELITRLGVETRFQAGMQAVRLGWL